MNIKHKQMQNHQSVLEADFKTNILDIIGFLKDQVGNFRSAM